MTHLEQSLQHDIDRICAKFTEMLALVVRALDDCVRSMEEKNRQLAYSVILRDQRIDELEKELDRLSLEFIVRQQPVARHLRFAYASIKINSKLERVGDYAESMARQILLLCSMEMDVPCTLFKAIAAEAIPMIGDAMTAFVAQNAEKARRTMEREDVVDQLRHDLSSQLLALHLSGKVPLEALIPLQNVLNRFERVADQARGICQDVLYMCTGEYIKHMGSEAFRVLFVDQDNGSASQMAEAIGTELGQDHFLFSSAGLLPVPLDATTMAFLGAKGMDISRQSPKSLEQIPHREHYQVVIALCKEAATAFPPPPTKVVCLDWSSSMSVVATGTPEVIQETLERNYRFLQEHLNDLVQAVLSDEPT